MSIKLASWNICLGLKSKKDYVYNTVKENKTDICLMQEVEVEQNYNQNLLKDLNYRIEIEINSIKSRSAIMIKNGINYKRKRDIEGNDLGLVIIDLNGSNKYRIVNLYRSFNPPNNASQLSFFKSQLTVLESALTTSKNCKIIIAGDFNLDENKRY